MSPGRQVMLVMGDWESCCLTPHTLYSWDLKSSLYKEHSLHRANGNANPCATAADKRLLVSWGKWDAEI